MSTYFQTSGFTAASIPLRKRSILAQSICAALFAGSILPAMSLAATVQGVKFNDLNGDGVKNVGEKGLANENLFIRSANAQLWNITTGLNGDYRVEGLAPGDYTIWSGVAPTDPAIAGQADWQQTTPEQGDFPPAHAFTLTADGMVINFGSWDGIPRETPKFVVDAGGDHAVDAGDKIDYQGSFTDPNTSGKHTVVWDFGDGNSKKQIVSNASDRSNTNTSNNNTIVSGTRNGLREGTATTTPIAANNTPGQPGTLTTTVTVTGSNGATATDTSTAIVRDNKTDPCATGVPTVRSVKSGDWFDATTWSPAVVPDKTAWVMISAGNTVTLKEPPIRDSTKGPTVKGLCVTNNAILASAPNAYGQPVTWVAVSATNIHNRGTIRGADGLQGLDPDGSGPKPFQHATAGSNLILRSANLINDGSIIAGNGGMDSTWTFMADDFKTPAIGGAGGSVEVFPGTITNNGLIQAGNGGIADRCNDAVTLCVHGEGIGGNGGLVRVMATDMANALNSSTGKVLGGRGGNAEIWYNGAGGRAGQGGDAEANFGDNKGTVKGGGPGSTVKVDPTTLKFDSTTRISDADNIVIFGGDDWTMELHNLAEGAISAAKTITIAVGKGGVVDLRGSQAKALVAAEKVEILSDSIILDDGVTLQELVESPNLVTGPAKILYSAAWSGVQQIVNEPGAVVPVIMTLLNNGPKEDTYTVTMSHSGNFEISEIPTDVAVNGQRRTEIEFMVTLPETRGVEDVMTLTATSQNDPTVQAVVEIRLSVKSEQPPVVVCDTCKATGKIVDKFNQPLAGVTVTVGDQSTTTRDNGEWEIPNVPEGQYQVIASKAGYVFKPQSCEVGASQPCAPNLSKPDSQLSVRVVPSTSEVKQGDNLVYTLTVTNKGTEAANQVTLTDTLPVGATLVAVESTQAQCDATTVSCTVPELAAGASATAQVTVHNSQANTLVNNVTVNNGDNRYPADIATTSTKVKPYLSVTVKDTPDPVMIQGQLHYALDVAVNEFAATPATAIVLTLQLPKEVALQTATTDAGTCDTSKSPMVTCTLNDLAVGSHATVNLDVALQDSGLLVLTHEAKVAASNYPVHLVRERTKIAIPDDIKVDVIFVVDTTGSMQEEINGTIEAIKKFIATIDPTQTPTVALVTFKDTVKVEAFTSDLKVLLSSVSKLKASGGGMCPEASAEALELAINHLKDGGVVLLSTDASPYEDADLVRLESLIKSKNMVFNAIITGDCSSKNSWNSMTDGN